MDLSELFWNAHLDTLKQGWELSGGQYVCLVCGEAFEDGAVYPHGERLYEARKAVQLHQADRHGSMLHYLLGLDKKATGLTDLQRDLLRSFAAGETDAEIVRRAGSGSASTIRNHRFALKEKAKQAKLFLAIMELMDEGASAGPKFVPVHRTATQVDERYAITEDEYAALLAKYMPDGPEGPLTGFPRKEKRKVALLRHISTFFEQGRTYKEKEVNEVLKRFLADDYVTLRRYLIEYGYLDRKDDGSAYWVKL
ncbi:DUF2087 domain-containing protein [Paenibacillus beijingensis]|uniref:Transcriptional regulator n=1 Tax=Paenibacillus beijingensis TaxID=1126833 RepID=A0A0D5NGH0_9BACL|nr:DUF2087 domain-containing protein [Paenibacillus beijingensis]AJY74013.1 transcriptional regulator [Paenibacillus beijingensis]